MPRLEDYVNDVALGQLIETARREDLGPAGIDATSTLFVDESARGRAVIKCRQPGTVAGLATLPRVVEAYDPHVKLLTVVEDGSAVEPGGVLAELEGPLASILQLERVALNLLGHLSGVATHTAAFAQRIAGTSAKIYDTRKTLPGLRGLQKYAVACGGGGTHRMGLYDAVLIKDNHLAHLPLTDWPEALRDVVRRAYRELPDLKFIMVEVDTLEQLEAVLSVGEVAVTDLAGQAANPTRPAVDLVLLDNMSPPQLREAVRRRDAAATAGPPPHRPRVPGLEASGGVTLDTVADIAAAGVDRISVGAITHSSVNLDIGLDVVA